MNEAERGVLSSIVRVALAEDIGTGDETTLSAVPAATQGRARIIARDSGVISGMEAAVETAQQVDASVLFECHRLDGEPVSAGDTVAVLHGPARSLLTMERVLLNFLQHFSGIATLTARFKEAVEGTGVAIADTRKTIPGLRMLEKAAVRHGGGTNHRFGLYDACMVKDNHIVAAGGLAPAVERVRRGFYQRGRNLHLTVEAKTVEEAREAAALGVDQILLDNMEPSTIRAAVEAIHAVESDMARAHRSLGVVAPSKPARIEVSGGVRLETVREKALPGVDWISVGALTHSAPALDLSMEIRLDEAAG